MDDLFQSGPAQLDFGLEGTAKRVSYEPDRDEIRAELTEILEQARAATDGPPWDERKTNYHRVVFPQMSRWLPDDEAEALRRQFAAELARLDAIA